MSDPNTIRELFNIINEELGVPESAPIPHDILDTMIDRFADEGDGMLAVLEQWERYGAPRLEE